MATTLGSSSRTVRRWPLLPRIVTCSSSRVRSRSSTERRCCAHCGRVYRHKDTKKITLRTLFGTLDVNSPRWLSCPCHSAATASFSPLATTLAEHTTPELVYLQARFAAVMSYAQAGALLGEVLPLGRTLHPSGVRAQLHQVATRLEAELGAEDTAGVGGCPRDWDALPRPGMPLTVGLDGGYVHSSTQTSRKEGWFEVVAGKSMPTDGEAKCFAFVQKIETKPRRRLFEVLSAQGMAANQSVTFLTDGGEDIRELPLYLYPQAEHYLDWFHITMRLTVMMNTAKSLPPLPTAGQEQAEGYVDRDQVAKDLKRLKWLLWHGNTFRADQVLSWLEDDLYSEDPGEAQRKLAKYLAEFAGYIRANTAWIPNYGERRRCGEAISSAFVESTVNQVVSKRMVKKQQMRWSPTGAQLFLQVRTQVLNNDLATHFERWYPDFTHHGGPVELAA
ncbi:MAG: ISKra4 family transposase [Pseudonocardiales bacterium]|nr:MAG: ISKra4 family transposase [Pseudonocardiales bacterium]